MASAAVWYLTIVAGQSLFISFIVRFYYTPTLTGHFEVWSQRHLITGYVPGDHLGNLTFAGHVLVAALVTASGVLQLVPQIRTHFRPFHRWNGRVYLLMGVLMALDGLWLTWVRGTYLTLWGLASGSLLGGLIIVSAAITLRQAIRRRIDAHRRWGLRTFLLLNAVWFQRIGYMAWTLIARGPVGMGKGMDGPFDIILGFAMYLAPLSVLELYLRAGAGGSRLAKGGAAVGLLMVTTVVAVGIYGTYAVMWRSVL